MKPISFNHLPTLTPLAEHALSGVGDPHLWEAIKRDIESNAAQLFECSDNTYLVLRIEGTELIILALVGKHAIEIMDFCVRIARAKGLPSVRFHTARPGLARLVKQFHPVELERVYKVDVK